MDIEKTLSDLVEDHNQRILQLVNNTLARFHSLEVPKVKDALAIFIAQNAPQLSSELANSLTNAIHEAGQRGLPADEDFINALRSKNFDVATVWQNEYKNLYNNLPAAI